MVFYMNSDEWLAAKQAARVALLANIKRRDGPLREGIWRGAAGHGRLTSAHQLMDGYADRANLTCNCGEHLRRDLILENDESVVWIGKRYYCPQCEGPCG